MTEQSRDEQAEGLLGKRAVGMPVFFPEELGFVCPICGLGRTFCDGKLQWSEYNCCIWCPDCNIDIPSCLCVEFTEPRLEEKPLSPMRWSLD